MLKSITLPVVSVFASSLVLALTSSAFAQAKPKVAVPAAPPVAAPASQTSSEADRKSVSITVYNQNFGVVREVRELATLGTGQVSLEFRDVAAKFLRIDVSEDEIHH